MTEPSALIVVDVQRGFADPAWGRRNNPECEANVERLVAGWRERGWPVVFVRHDSAEPGSPLSPGQPGNELMVSGEPDLLVTKSVNSSFHGTPSLQNWLDGEGLRRIHVCGITTNHCCETTARVGGNLGYDVAFVLDATAAFDMRDLAGETIPADQIARVTAANLHGEFATVVDTEAALAEG
jgi:nicotinamidase-related amidase